MATASQLDIVIRAQDRASAALGSVKKSVGGLEKVTRGFGLSSALAYTSAGFAIGGFLKTGIDKMMEMEDATVRANAVIKSTGGVANVTAEHMADLAQRLFDVSAVDDEVIQNGEAVLLTFTRIRNEVGAGNDIFDQATEAALNMSVALGEDLQSAVIQLGKALQDPIAGVTALRRVGVMLTDQQQEEIKTLMAVGDQMGAQKIILAELTTEFGGMSKAVGDTYSAKVKKAKEATALFAAEVVIKLIPIIEREIEGFRILGDRIEDVTDFLEAARRRWIAFTEMVDVTGIWDGMAEAGKGGGAAFGASFMESLLQTIYPAKAAIQDALTVGPMPLPPILQAGAMHDSILKITQDWEKAQTAAQAADEAFLAALGQASPEHLQRNLALKQAKFNVGILEQKKTQGPLSPENESWYNYLVSTFIPAQESWLESDRQHVEVMEAAALLSKAQTGDMLNTDQAIRGNLTPSFESLTDATYDGEDAAFALRNALRTVKGESPIDVVTSFGETSFPPGKTPNEIIASGIYDPTETVKVGMQANGFGGVDKTPNGIIASGVFDPTETVKVFMRANGWGGIPNTPNGIIASGIYDPTETVKVGMHLKGSPFPEGLTPNQIIASGKFDPTETVKVGMHTKGAPFPPGLTPNAIIASGVYDPTETVKVGMSSRGFDPGKTPNAIIASGIYDPTETVKVGMTAHAVDSLQAVKDLIANIQWHWSQLWMGIGFGATANGISGIAPPGTTASQAPVFLLAPGAVSVTGVNFSSEAERQSVADQLWRAIARRMAQG